MYVYNYMCMCVCIYIYPWTKYKATLKNEEKDIVYNS